ncbi:hypothetical protein D9M68_982560 [compost metagenome]
MTSAFKGSGCDLHDAQGVLFYQGLVERLTEPVGWKPATCPVAAPGDDRAHLPGGHDRRDALRNFIGRWQRVPVDGFRFERHENLL